MKTSFSAGVTEFIISTPLLYRSSLLGNYQSTITELQYNDEVVEKLSKLSLKSLKI